jgi:hypothetical protein
MILEYDYAGLLGGFGQSMGFTELGFDEDGSCNLLINEERSMHIRKDEDADHIVLTSVVAHELPDPVDYSLVCDLLEYALSPAFSTGPAVGLDRESGLLIAYAILPMKHLDVGELTLAIGKFLEFQVLMETKIRGDGPQALADNAPTSYLTV